VLAAPSWELVTITAILRSNAGFTDFPHLGEATVYVLTLHNIYETRTATTF